MSRLYITFAMNKVYQYMHAPIENHWSTGKQLIRYLKGTLAHGLVIRHESGSHLQAFTNAY